MKNVLYFPNHDALIWTLLPAITKARAIIKFPDASKNNWFMLTHGSHQKYWLKSQDSPGFFSLFPVLLASKFQDLSRTFNKCQDFPGILRSCTHSKNKIYFLQNKNIYPVVYTNNSTFIVKAKINAFHNIYYILLYWFFTPGNWSFILTFWLKDWKAESNYWPWFFSQYKRFKGGIHQVCLAFFAQHKKDKHWKLDSVY